MNTHAVSTVPLAISPNMPVQLPPGTCGKTAQKLQFLKKILK
jgi:hypothetical protein